VTYASPHKSCLDGYTTALCREVEQFFQRGSPGSNVSFAALGGGTPFLLSAENLQKILTLLRKGVGQRARVSIETTPSEIAREDSSRKLELLRDFGVKRISLGVQSWNDSFLRAIGVRHNRETAVRAVKKIRSLGFEHINVDLMFGCVEGEERMWEETAEYIGQILPESVSLYQYRSLPSGPGKRRILEQTSSRLAVRETIYRFLLKEGYLQCGRHYSRGKEIFANEKPVHDWMTISGNWLAFGINARSTFENGGYRNVRDINKYCELLREGLFPVAQTVRYNDRDLQKRFILCGLVHANEIDCDEYTQKFKRPFSARIIKRMENLVDDNILVKKGRSYKLMSPYVVYDREVINYLCA